MSRSHYSYSATTFRDDVFKTRNFLCDIWWTMLPVVCGCRGFPLAVTVPPRPHQEVLQKPARGTMSHPWLRRTYLKGRNIQLKTAVNYVGRHRT